MGPVGLVVNPQISADSAQLNISIKSVREGGKIISDTDRRVRRTRKALHDALLDLMVEKRYDAITVQDIIDRADIGRSTFYSHFTDKRDLLDSGFEDLSQLLAQPPRSPTERREDPLRFSLAMFRHAHEHQRLARALVARSGANPVQDRLHQVLRQTIRAELDGWIARRHGSVPPDDLTVAFLAGAFLAVMASWLDTAPDRTPEEIDDLFHTFIDPGLRAALRLDGPVPHATGTRQTQRA